jgi:hypothetical protein
MIFAAGLALARSLQSNFHGCNGAAIEAAGNHDATPSIWPSPQQRGGNFVPCMERSELWLSFSSIDGTRNISRILEKTAKK